MSRDPWVTAVHRVAQSYADPEAIELTLVAEGHRPSEAYLLVQAGLLYRAWQHVPTVTPTSTLPPPE